MIWQQWSKWFARHNIQKIVTLLDFRSYCNYPETFFGGVGGSREAIEILMTVFLCSHNIASEFSKICFNFKYQCFLPLKAESFSGFLVPHISSFHYLITSRRTVGPFFIMVIHSRIQKILGLYCNMDPITFFLGGGREIIHSNLISWCFWHKLLLSPNGDLKGSWCNL